MGRPSGGAARRLAACAERSTTTYALAPQPWDGAPLPMCSPWSGQHAGRHRGHGRSMPCDAPHDMPASTSSAASTATNSSASSAARCAATSDPLPRGQAAERPVRPRPGHCRAGSRRPRRRDALSRRGPRRATALPPAGRMPRARSVADRLLPERALDGDDRRPPHPGRAGLPPPRRRRWWVAGNRGRRP